MHTQYKTMQNTTNIYINIHTIKTNQTTNQHYTKHYNTIQHNTTQYKTKQHKQNHTHIIQTILHITNQLNIIKIEPKHYKQRKQQNTILHKTTQHNTRQE